MAVQTGFAYTPPPALKAGSNENTSFSNDAPPALKAGTNQYVGDIANLVAADPLFESYTVYTGFVLLGSGYRPDVYIMRAYKTTPTTGHVYWISLDEPDLTGTLSGFPIVDLADIVVLREPCR